MSGIWTALIAGIAAYLLLRAFKLTRAVSLLIPLRLLLGIVLVAGSCISVFVVGMVLAFCMDVLLSSNPQNVVGAASLLVLILMSALSFAIGHSGTRLIVTKKDDSLSEGTGSGQQLEPVRPDESVHEAARAGSVPATSDKRAPEDVDGLREIPNAAQVEGESPRRWFFSHEQDLLVWFGPDGRPSAFQLAYGKYRNEHALRWKVDRGFGHYVVDDGELGGGGAKQAALLQPDGVFPASKVLKRFLALSAEVPGEIVEFVAQRLQEHPEYREDV